MPRPAPHPTSRFVAVLLTAAVAITGVAGWAATPAPASRSGGEPTAWLFVGTRADGPATGIRAAGFDAATGRMTERGLAAAMVHPTWLLSDPRHPMLYSVSEVGNDGLAEASVHGFAVDRSRGTLAPAGTVASGGGGATFLAMANRGGARALMVANYGSGTVAALPIAADGTLRPAASTIAETGRGPSPRQAGPHPHGIAIDPAGRSILVADLGADRIFVHPYDPGTGSIGPAGPGSLSLPPGTLPRHVVLSPDGRTAYVNAEPSGDIIALRWHRRQRRLMPIQTLHTRAPGYTGAVSAAEIALSGDGRFLYASNRGEDDVIVLAVNRANGRLREVQRLASGGTSPNALALDPSGRWLVVANEASDRVSAFARDRGTGRLSGPVGSIDTPHPVSLAFLAARPADNAKDAM